MFLRFSGFLFKSRKQVLLTIRLMLDSDVVLWKKAIPLLPLLYLLSPLNFLSSLIPIIGQLEDVLLVALALKLFESVVDESVINKHRVEQDNRSKQA